MAAEAILGIFLKILSCVGIVLTEQIVYINNYEDNLTSLRNNLRTVCDKNRDMERELKIRKDNLEDITSEAAAWLSDVRILGDKEELKEVIHGDLQTAKLVVIMTGKNELNARMRKDSKMQKVVIEVMKLLRSDYDDRNAVVTDRKAVETDHSVEKMKKIAEDDLTRVTEIVIEVMKDAIEEFKMLLKEDKTVLAIVAKNLSNKKLNDLLKDDDDMEEILRTIRDLSDEELRHNHEDDDHSRNQVAEAARKLISPLHFLMAGVKKLMDDDANKLNHVYVKLAIDVIDGLLITVAGEDEEMDDTTKLQKGCCGWRVFTPRYFYNRIKISKAAEALSTDIREYIVDKYPMGRITMPVRISDLEPIPTGFLELKSRTPLLDDILLMLEDEKVRVGVVGMGGIGKTTLAKEVRKRATIDVKVLVEVTDAPNIVNIQGAIADKINLDLDNLSSSVTTRATLLYNALRQEKRDVLIVLDNIWKELNLSEIGIPDTCKLLLTTREERVCQVMKVEKKHIVNVETMNIDESRALFGKLTSGNQIHLAKYQNVISRLLKTCGGLPLTIRATANALKEKDLPDWEQFANDSEKPISSQDTSEYHHMYPALNTSYNFIEVHEKRIFLLLCCLSPPGSSVSFKSLIKYGIGLNLFQNVNKLSEAVSMANKWVVELKSSSMLLEGIDGEIKIHDSVRDFAIKFAAKKEKHKFMVEAIPRWLDGKTLTKYTAMSLRDEINYSRLNQHNLKIILNKLQILKLEGNLSSKLSNSFFDKMVNLEVLDLSNMDFDPILPTSMSKLKTLKTLCLERCKLANTEEINKLKHLLVLSLRKSSLNSFPIESEGCPNLRLLDLDGCTCTNLLVPDNFLSKHLELEGLYMFNISPIPCKNESAGVIESSGLPDLNALKREVDQIGKLNFSGKSLQSIENFKVSIGKMKIVDGTQIRQYRRILYCDGIENLSTALNENEACLKALLKKADYLKIRNCGNFKDLVPQLEQEEYRDLRYLKVDACDDVEYIVNRREINNDKIAFPCLDSLELRNLAKLEMLCEENVSKEVFSELQTLTLNKLGLLQYVLAHVHLPPNLNEINVKKCDSLNFLVVPDEETPNIDFRSLKALELKYLTNLACLVKPKNFDNTSNALPENPFFFNGETSFPSLEKLNMTHVPQIKNLWNNDISKCGFQNLKIINIKRCEKMLSIGSPSVFSVLEQLETLSIVQCAKMSEVIKQEPEIDEEQHQIPASNNLSFPNLKTLTLDDLELMKRFAALPDSSSEDSLAFFNEIKFPSLEKLKVRKVKSQGLQLWASSDAIEATPMLKYLTLGSTAKLPNIPSVVMKNLSNLTLSTFEDDRVIFSSTPSSVWTYSQLPQLQCLIVKDSKSLENLLGEEDENSVTAESDKEVKDVFCGNLKKLELIELSALKARPFSVFTGLTSLIIDTIEWEYAIDMSRGSLQQLETLSIQNCENMVAVMNNVDSLPRLHKLDIQKCPELRQVFYGTRGHLDLPSLSDVTITQCEKLSSFSSGSFSIPKLFDITYGNKQEEIESANYLNIFLEESSEKPR